MKELGRFDPDNGGMFVEEPHDFKSMNHIRDLRRRAERGEFGPKPLSVPRGELVFRLEVDEIADYVQKEKRARKPAFGLTKSQALLAHIARTGDY